MAGLDAAGLVGLLADAHRRRVVAAIELGAVHVDEVVEASGLNGTQVAKALGRLVESGLVIQSESGLAVHAAAFQAAAKEANGRPATPEDFGDVSEAARKTLAAIVSGGRLKSIPVAPAKRSVVLDWLAQDFEPGRRYTEQMVNLILGQRHADTAALRRYLVDGGFLDRSAGEYWRSGGTVSE